MKKKGVCQGKEGMENNTTILSFGCLRKEVQKGGELLSLAHMRHFYQFFSEDLVENNTGFLKSK